MKQAGEFLGDTASLLRLKTQRQISRVNIP